VEVLTLQKTKEVQIASVSTSDKSIDELLSKEWLLTNERGSYASSTVIGCNTRSYHGLLVGSLNPPANRIMALANCLEMVIHDTNIFKLSTFEFNDKLAPLGYVYLKQFRQDQGVHFDYRLDDFRLMKSLYLLRDIDTAVILYNFTEVGVPIEFVLRPFVGLRDFHTLQKSYAPLCSRQCNDGLVIRHNVPDSCELFLSCPSMNFEQDPQWWFSFVYRNDRERGQSFTEDLWTPGFFKCRIKGQAQIVFQANLSNCYRPEYFVNAEINGLRETLRRHQIEVITAAKAKDEKFKILCLAADRFIAKRHSDHNNRITILAGFPWFADWGRDAFISLPGLLLITGRFGQAKSVLTTFANAADEGMIPNRFDERSNTACFNSVDASLWFINAAFQYLEATNDLKTFTQELLPVIHWIIESYQKGTRFDIHADSDGLITAGNSETQLTWMDAKYDGIAFTPRWGKAVEVNALWHNCLCLLARFYSDRNQKSENYYGSLAAEVADSFSRLFWNEQCGYLNDVVLPDGSVDATLRPNQIFAVSLPFAPPLLPEQQKSIVNVVYKALLTPYGLRTLNVQHPHYKKIYTGPMRDRDEAYHQGTVWPYLIGPFIEAYLKVNGYSKKSKQEAAELIQPLMRHLTEDACLGSISEIFDGNTPHVPKGCIAQAWSVAELLRAHKMIYA
jgi:predicted glycogen debranching enzyme